MLDDIEKTDFYFYLFVDILKLGHMQVSTCMKSF